MDVFLKSFFIQFVLVPDPEHVVKFELKNKTGQVGGKTNVKTKKKKSLQQMKSL